MAKNKTAITPTREENFNEWYQQVVKKADLAENSTVRGCMIVKPHGFSLWENIQKDMDARFKALGVKNAYFPLLIPLSSLEKEAQHVEGFAKECAVVTHRRLVQDGDKLIPEGKLEEPYVIRPTSEMIIGESFSNWIKSYRDLPFKINQWANVMRWEMRPRVFLRTSEFLWQEGHTVHATSEEAREMSLEILELYRNFVEETMGVALIVGEKTESERFPGADSTYTIEAVMQDGKALQAGTSHYLGQNFSKAQGIKFLDSDSEEKYAYTTSWGASTRLIGGLIMTHGDDNGLIIPPKLASTHIMVCPIFKKDEEREEIEAFVSKLKADLKAQSFFGRDIEIEVDWRDIRGGEKYWDNVRKGFPVIIEVGKRDLAKGQVAFTRRDTGVGAKEFIKVEDFVSTIGKTLENIQETLFNRSKNRILENVIDIDSKENLQDFFKEKSTPLKLGKAYLKDCEEVRNLLSEHKMSFRCMPISEPEGDFKCIVTGESVTKKVVFAQSY